SVLRRDAGRAGGGCAGGTPAGSPATERAPPGHCRRDGTGGTAGPGFALRQPERRGLTTVTVLGDGERFRLAGCPAGPMHAVHGDVNDLGSRFRRLRPPVPCRYGETRDERVLMSGFAPGGFRLRHCRLAVWAAILIAACLLPSIARAVDA